MIRTSLLLTSLILLRLSLFSQRVIEVSYAQDSHGNMVFSCTNRAFCTYVVRVGFTTFENAKADHALPYEEEVKPGINKLFTVGQIKTSDDIQIKYTASYQKGCLHPTPHPDFTYLLPIGPGKETQAYEINKTFVAGQDSGFAIRLKMKQGDTIYSARRGTVTAVNTNSAENDAGATATDSWNYIEIVHEDCSFGLYGVLKKEGAFVHPGQMVEAGMPVGLVGGDKFSRGSDVRFSVGFYQGPRSIPLPLQFWTKRNGKGPLKHGGTYISEHPRAIVTQELPKAPVKKLAAKKKGA